MNKETFKKAEQLRNKIREYKHIKNALSFIKDPRERDILKFADGCELMVFTGISKEIIPSEISIKATPILIEEMEKEIKRMETQFDNLQDTNLDS